MNVIPFRFPPELLDRLDAHTKRLEKRNPGVRITRADALRHLLIAALDQEEARDARKTT